MSLIRVDDLTFAYPGSYDNVYDHVSFQFDTDWKLGFLGRNGRGKTTFLRLLMGQKIQHHRRPAGVATPAAPKQQRVEYFRHRVVDGRRLKNAEKQVVPEALDLHILTRDHAEIWQ